MTINDIDQTDMDLDALCTVILSNWNLSCDESNRRLGMYIFELILRRDSLEPWLLSKNEIQDVIELISTCR